MADISPLTLALSGRYEIEREVGRGGMATVYLARDVRHDRRVAVKVLHPDLAAALGAERFLAEIRTTANLQHPHILPLHDSGTTSSHPDPERREGEGSAFLYYVMPFVEGESLRQRLEREGPLPIDVAQRIAREMLSALDYAHRHGVVHRDIKPENILLHDGSALVADFGIALAVQSAGGPRMTQTGLSLGTPQYMSPEQAMGERNIDARADVYAAGAVIYEMLTGDPPFTGSSVQAIVAKVMTERPTPPSTTRDTVPPNVEAAVLRALAKLPADRFPSAAQFADALVDTRRVETAAALRVAPQDSARLRWWKMAVAGLAVVTATSLAVAARGARRGTSAPVERYDLTALGIRFVSTQATLSYEGQSFALSPTGRIAYVGRDSGGARVFIRDLSDIQPRVVQGTEGAQSVTLSPDGQNVAFIEGGALKTAGVSGGAVATVVPQGASSPTWAADGMLYYVTTTAAGGGISRIAPAGGSPEVLLPPTKSRVSLADPSPLPGGKALLVTHRGTPDMIATVTLNDGKIHDLVNAIHPAYVAPGYVVFLGYPGTLVAAPFDVHKLAITGPALTILGRGAREEDIASQYAVGDTNSIVYMTGGQQASELVWVSRDGSASIVDSTFIGNIGYPTISRDGSRVAVRHKGSVWIKQLDRGPLLNVTLKGGNYAAWTADGRSISYFVRDSTPGALTFGTSRDYHLYTRAADGSTQPSILVPKIKGITESLWSPDGKWLVYRTSADTVGGGDIFALQPGVDSAPRPIAATSAIEVEPALSPDGHWLAYASDESGRYEIYVVPFPNPAGARWAVSSNGGLEPVWSPRGDELFYRDGASRMTAVKVTTGPAFAMGQTTTLFPAIDYATYGGHRQYDVSADGKRFLMIRQARNAAPPRVVLVRNWLGDAKAHGAKP
jgi:eukaryotic-like serine/threonine-protein kinase